jgi:hypothetical protein
MCDSARSMRSLAIRTCISCSGVGTTLAPLAGRLPGRLNPEPARLASATQMQAPWPFEP